MKVWQIRRGVVVGRLDWQSRGFGFDSPQQWLNFHSKIYFRGLGVSLSVSVFQCIYVLTCKKKNLQIYTANFVIIHALHLDMFFSA